MRITRNQLGYYIDLLNGLLGENEQVTLDIAYGGCKLRCHCHELTPYRMTVRECYYVVLGMYNLKIQEMRYQ